MHAIVPIVAFCVLVVATGSRLYVVLRLLHGYRAESFGTDPTAKRMLRDSRIAMLAMTGAILTLAVCSGIWWVEGAGGLFALFACGRMWWAIWMRRSGRHVAYYQARRWS